MKKILYFSIVMLLFVVPAYATFIPADIVWIIDNSGSMSGDAAAIKNGINSFDNQLIAAGIDAKYALVTYLTTPVLRTDLTNPAGLQTAINGVPWSGGIQNGYGAIAGSLTSLGISFRPGAVKTLILITDEDADDYGAGSSVYPGGATALGNLLDANKALLNIIYDPTYPDAYNDYGGSGIARPAGATFNLNTFKADPNAFLDAFAQTKIKEIQDNIVPEPGTVLLLVSGALSLAGYTKIRYNGRKRK
jgi:hypothetical protein